VAETELKRIAQLRETDAASRSEFDKTQADLLRQTQAVQSLRNALAILPTRIAAARASEEYPSDAIPWEDADVFAW